MWVGDDGEHVHCLGVRPESSQQLAGCSDLICSPLQLLVGSCHDSSSSGPPSQSRVECVQGFNAALMTLLTCFNKLLSVHV